MNKLVILFFCGVCFAQTPDRLYSDVPEGHWASASIARLSQLGVVIGFPDGTFRGDEPYTRYQAALLNGRLLDLMNAALAQEALLREERLAMLQTQLDAVSEALAQASELRNRSSLAFEERFSALEEQLSVLSADYETLAAALSSGELRGPAGPPGPRGPTGPPGAAGKDAPLPQGRPEPEPVPQPFELTTPQAELPQPRSESLPAPRPNYVFGLGGVELTSFGDALRTPVTLGLGRDGLIFGLIGLRAGVSSGRQGALLASFSVAGHATLTPEISDVLSLAFGAGLGYTFRPDNTNGVFLSGYAAVDAWLGRSFGVTGELDLAYLPDPGPYRTLYPTLSLGLKYRF